MPGDRVKEIKAILDKLPTRADQPTDLDDEAEHLDHFLRFPPSSHQLSLRLRSGSSGTSEIDQFCKALDDMYQAAMAMSFISRLVLRKASSDWEKSSGTSDPSLDDIGAMAKAWDPERVDLVRSAVHAFPWSDILSRRGSRRGCRPNKKARDIVFELALAYNEITGQPPTMRTDWDSGRASGPFLELVNDVFELANIDASPVTYTRQAVKEFREFYNTNLWEELPKF